MCVREPLLWGTREAAMPRPGDRSVGRWPRQGIGPGKLFVVGSVVLVVCWLANSCKHLPGIIHVSQSLISLVEEVVNDRVAELAVVGLVHLENLPESRQVDHERFASENALGLRLFAGEQAHVLAINPDISTLPGRGRSGLGVGTRNSPYFGRPAAS